MKRLSLISACIWSVVSPLLAIAAESAPVVDSGCVVPPSNMSNEFKKWNNTVEDRIKKYFQPYRFSKERDIQVKMQINKLGVIEDAEIKSSSWSVESDVAALEACWNCGPLPNVPLDKYAMLPPTTAETESNNDGTNYIANFEREANAAVFAGARSFFKSHPEEIEKRFAVHAIPLAVLERYPAAFTKEELSGIKNLMFFPKNSYTYENTVKAWYSDWQEFYISKPRATRKEIIDYVNKRASKRFFEK